MTSFTEFVIALFEKLGIFYIFSIIFVTVVVYFLTYFLLSTISKQGDKQILSDKMIKAISLIIAISIAILFGYEYRLSILIRYFVSSVAVSSVVIFFVLVIIIFILGSKPTISSRWVRNFSILALAFLVVFAFLSFYIAYRDWVISVSLGGVGPETAPEAVLIGYAMRAEFLVIPFLFLFMGLIVWIIGMEERNDKTL